MKLKCPICKSENIMYYMGAQFGKYECKDCGYVGVIVIEDANEKSIKKSNRRARAIYPYKHWDKHRQ